MIFLSWHDEKGVKIDKRSRFFETPSYPDKKNPKFINIVISINTNLSINNLIDLIIFAEEKLGRKRIRKNDPRNEWGNLQRIIRPEKTS